MTTIQFTDDQQPEPVSTPDDVQNPPRKETTGWDVHNTVPSQQSTPTPKWQTILLWTFGVILMLFLLMVIFWIVVGLQVHD